MAPVTDGGPADLPDRPPPAPLGIGRLLAPLYRAAVARRNRAFDAGRRVVNVGAPVISVGNISVGGVGKTPLVVYVAETLLENGLWPAVAMRGYRARRGEPSDEEAELTARLPDTPIIADPDRARAIRAYLDAPEGARRRIDCVVLDDGFQHRFVERDLDLVLIDATRDPFRDSCLPAGWLREPVEALARADRVVLTHGERVARHVLDDLAERIERVHGRPPLAASAHAWSHLRAGDERLPVEWLRARRVFALSAIGNPAAFVAGLRDAGAAIVGERRLADHARYTPAAIERVRRDARRAGAEAVVTTEKDWVKVAPCLAALARRPGEAPGPGAPFVRPALRLEFIWGSEALRESVLVAARGAGVLR